MGTNIHGWVEARDATVDVEIDEILWFAVIEVGFLLHRNYTAFGSLFGVRNHTDFAPIAAGRGLPDHVSSAVRAEATGWDSLRSHTWVSWAELKAVDWEERALAGMAFGYTRGEQTYSAGVYLDRTDPRRVEGRTWTDGETTYRVETISRRQALGQEFPMLFRLMEVLAERHGDEYVRLVVWFDNYG